MLKIRLKRIGRKGEPHYRIVVIPARTKRDGKAIEYIGYYNPHLKETKLNKERAKYWLSVGAQPTDTLRSILAKFKLVEKPQRPDRPPKKPKKELKGEKEKVKPKKKMQKPKTEGSQEKKSKGKELKNKKQNKIKSDKKEDKKSDKKK